VHYDFLLSFILTVCDGCTGEEKPIARYKTRVKVAEDNKLFILSSFLGSTSKLGVI